jgi:hypothetical protein
MSDMIIRAGFILQFQLTVIGQTIHLKIKTLAYLTH